MNRALIAFLALSLAALVATSRAGVVSMAWSPVGNPGNAADPSTGLGSVDYSYYIGTYDVTVNQYVAFLNANDPTGGDSLALYNAYMGFGLYEAVDFNSGAPQGQKYSAISGTGNHPINWVTWFDAIRFANWMDNGEPVFTSEPTATNNATEHGAYTLTGFTPVPSNGASITRNTGAVVFLPNEDEWYKAAYYNPATSSYFLYPTSSNTAPNATTPTSVPNSANYSVAVYNLTNVGAYSGTTSPYGAYDMGGDVWQWNEAPSGSGGNRVLRGGAWGLDPGSGESSYSTIGDPFSFLSDFGFRLAMVPEPSSIVLATAGCVVAFVLRKHLLGTAEACRGPARVHRAKRPPL